MLEDGKAYSTDAWSAWLPWIQLIANPVHRQMLEKSVLSASNEK